MDPQTQVFNPYSSNNDTWRLQAEVARVQQIQAEHSERIARLERRQDDDARMKSVWGSSSPFPSVLTGTPQQGPMQHPSSEQFRNFDDEANNLISSLHLDAEDEPRRGMGANSRANSVRFDESANQNHFSHSSRTSVDFLSRTSSGMGGLQMTERSSSHKSDGRASSAHSMRSAASGRASSLNLDTGYCLGDSNRSPLDTPALAPGLLLLGSVPAIIRCWMNTNFKHDALLYAAVCTGSYRSYLDLRLIKKLGFEQSIVTKEEEDTRTVDLPVYFPEAVPHPASSRSSSPAPQLPTLTVTFQVIESGHSETESRAIQIFIGSDTLRAHNADILFSSNSMTLFDDDRSKLSIPLVRPEDEAAFKTLFVGSENSRPSIQPNKSVEASKDLLPPFAGKHKTPSALSSEVSTTDPVKAGAVGSDNEARPASRQSNASRPSLTLLNTRSDTRSDAGQQLSDSGSQTTTLRSGSSPAIWSNWRKDGGASQSTGLDWASASRNRETSYQRRESGIKVLKPKNPSRTLSTSATSSAAGNGAVDGRSRISDDGRRRDGPESTVVKAAVEPKENQHPSAINSVAPVSRLKTNPIGGGSAFSWLNPGGGK
ncbi:hypothetical protein M433DRAFT_69110 [Acidomyces richmondensis BFW]|nr:MAG: hypothetical protein FE78DRAFT_151580 [Acidomyces sp. 'richmondensis']KYG44568.1 hypothetical protein M433DRAFT_69110 [Acidomyces richmondensis BFW]